MTPDREHSGPDGPAPGRAGSATDADRRWLTAAVALAGRCAPSESAFSVGAVLVATDGQVIADGYSRERDLHDHAEEVALATAAEAGADDAALAGATMYTSLEPCRRRLSRPRSCSELIVAAGIGRVVLAWIEPPLFVPGGGTAWLRDQGVTVIQIPELAAAARAVNAHLLPG
jgi:diaminohydroxyphosphoribosylaminopyrimidine deaminase/5-amino-6-(5-phosphoribosylamino)uracil reductase